jgi:signal transduction histidine kinase
VENIESIFEMGVSTTSGSGLGLYHCRDIVKKLGGKIYALDNNQQGLEIRVELTK